MSTTTPRRLALCALLLGAMVAGAGASAPPGPAPMPSGRSADEARFDRPAPGAAMPAGAAACRSYGGHRPARPFGSAGDDARGSRLSRWVSVRKCLRRHLPW